MYTIYIYIYMYACMYVCMHVCMYVCVCAHGRGSCIHVSCPLNEQTGMGLNLSHLMKSNDLPPRTLRQRAVHLKAHNVVPHS